MHTWPWGFDDIRGDKGCTHAKEEARGQLMCVGKRTLILTSSYKKKKKRERKKSSLNLKGEGGSKKEQMPRRNFANLEREERDAGGGFHEYEREHESSGEVGIFKVLLDVINVSLCILLRDSREVLICFQLFGDVALMFL